MATRTGTLTIDDLLAVENQSVAEYGLDNVQNVIEADVEAHNGIVEELIEEICEITTDRQRKQGASQEGEMTEVDELGRVKTQQTKPGATVAFPLRKFTYGLGWTSTWFEVKTPRDMARAVLAAEKAHLRAIQNQIKYAIFRSTNYTYNDHLVDKVDLAVKRFVNADSAPIPEGPNGEVFNAATHTHYNFNASLTNAVLLALVDDVVEHGHGSMVKLAVNRGNESAVRALDDFTPYVDPRVIPATTADVGAGALDISRVDNRAIGIFGAAEVWVKPWVPANYAFAWDASDTRKPLGFRQRSQETLQGLRIAAELHTHPLYAQYMEAEFGVGANERTNGAVLFFNGGSYTDPF